MLATHAPEILRNLSPSNSSEEFVWRNSLIHTSLGIFASPAGVLLDMVTLSKALGSIILPFKDFRNFSNHVLDELIVASVRLTGGIPELNCSSSRGYTDAEFFGQTWGVGRVSCLLDECIEPSFSKAVKDNPAKNLAVAYDKARLCLPGHGPSVQWLEPSFHYFRTRSALRFSGPVLAHALDFIQREFDALPFLGIHWRRGDRLVYTRWGLSVDPATVVERAWEECARLDLSHVYLMTNCGTPGDVDRIAGELRGRGVQAVERLAGLGSWEDEDRRLAVEMAIVSFAEHVLTSASAVSSTVVEERLLLGHAADAWSHLARGTSDAADYQANADALQREMDADAELRAAVAAQAGQARLTLDCLHRAGPAECAADVVEAGRAIAERLSGA
jgi:hypothetical protein